MPNKPRKTVENCMSISMPWLSRHGYLEGFKAGKIAWTNGVGEEFFQIETQVSIEEKYLRLSYSRGEKINLEVELVTTPCHYGNVRYWFLCPLTSCNKRIGKLYLPKDAQYFGCRNCYNLTYKCQKEANKKVNRLVKNPKKLLSMMSSGDLNSSLLAMKAYDKIKERF